MSGEALSGMIAGEPEQAAVFLAQLTNEFASSLDVEETLRTAIDRFMVYLNAEAASIFLLEDDASALVCRECAGPVDIRGLRLEPDQGIVGQTVQHNEPKIVRDVSLNPSFASDVDEDTGFATRSILCAPLSVRGTCLGALELLNKRTDDGLFDMNDMQLATTVASAAALAIHNARMAAELVEQERVRKELELARQIQESLLPDNNDAGFPVHGLNIPAREVSGDFFDYMLLDDGRVYFALADVSGKGMNAALLMAKTTSLLRCLAKTARDAGELLAKVNDEICETSTMGMFVTIVAGYLDPLARTVELANAGHQAALIHRGGEDFDEVAAAAPPLGVLPDTEFPIVELALGADAIYLYTDGLSESVGRDGRELASEGLKQMIKSAAATSAEGRLAEIVREWAAAGHHTHDDITLMLVAVPERGERQLGQFK
ncbi:MAG: PP2C family protein-serine/threonine phosphatase [Gammaproteobacteria bacterium]